MRGDGRIRETRDTVRRDALERLAATLDTTTPVDAVPACWHWTAFLGRTPTAGLGPDGHPKKAGFVEDLPHPRRMFAGGRLRIVGRLTAEQEIVRRTSAGAFVHREGSQGPLAFVTVTHEYTVGGHAVLTEEQDLVYRPAVARTSADVSRPTRAGDPTSGRSPVEAPLVAHRRQVFDETHLFRFSALTFNSHRIHYDLRYTTEVEGYPSLIVQGPLLVVSLLELVRDAYGDEAVTELDFRVLAPAHVGDALDLEAREDGPRGLALEARRGDTVLMRAGVRLCDPA